MGVVFIDVVFIDVVFIDVECSAMIYENEECYAVYVLRKDIGLEKWAELAGIYKTGCMFLPPVVPPQKSYQ
jgi:hypothetical protein